MNRKLIRLFMALLTSVITIILFNVFFYSVEVVDGHSMQPALENDDKVLINKAIRFNG